MLKEMERLREEELRAQVEKQMKAKDLVAQVRHAACPIQRSRLSTSGASAACWSNVLAAGSCAARAQSYVHMACPAESKGYSQIQHLQVMTANEEQVERKKEMQQLELDEEARIADYIRVRDLREQAVADEKEAIAREKEAETQRLRAAQEKAADKQSEMDELRARRHAAAAERERRGREASKAARNKVRCSAARHSRLFWC